MYRLIRTPEPPPVAPVLDAAQQAVVDHPGGPLLVLAGPGTGKTTTLVESVVDRIERRGVDPGPDPGADLLPQGGGRPAGADRRPAGPLHGHADGDDLPRLLLRPGPPVRRPGRPAPRPALGPGPAAHRPGAGVPGPRDAAGQPRDRPGRTGRTRWPGPFGPGRSPARSARCWPRPGSSGMDPDDVVAAGEAAGRPEWVGVGEFFDEYLDVLDAEGVLDYAELVHRCRILLADPEIVGRRCAREIDWVFVDEYQDTDPAQVRLLQAIAGDGRDVVVVGDPDQSIYAFRGAEARGILDFPDRFRTADGAPAPVRRPGHDPTVRAGAAGGQPQRRRPARAAAGAAGRGVRRRSGEPAAGAGPGPRVGARSFTCTSAGRRGRAHRRDPAQRAPARRPGLGRDGGAGAVRPAR